MDAKHTLGEPRLLISRAALLHNAAVVRAAVGPAVKLCAIVKADAYGHGAALVVETLTQFNLDGQSAPPVDAFAVASIDEAANLPPTDRPILIFRPVENTFLGRQRSRIEHAIRHGWVLTVCSPSAADDIARVAVAAECRANVQIMLDTGMTRSGADADDAESLVRKVLDQPALRLHGLCSHFACSEEPDHPANASQLAVFQKLSNPWTDPARCDGRRIVRHIANSGAVFNARHAHFDMVRPGIALYGIDPTCRPDVHRKLRPALRWTAPLVMVRDVPAGVSVGYGQTWTAPRATRLGLIPVGYADGYMRAFSSAAKVMIHGRPAPVVGRVSMDLITVDLGEHPQTHIGDEVTLLDSDPLSPASAYALSAIGGTIPYELFCGIGARMHRVAVDDPQPAAVA